LGVSEAINDTQTRRFKTDTKPDPGAPRTATAPRWRARCPRHCRSGFRVQGAGCRVQGSGCRDQGAGFRVQGAGIRVLGAGFRVQG
jgi:hypothetical protein